jgi:hypothetical protein
MAKVEASKLTPGNVIAFHDVDDKKLIEGRVQTKKGNPDGNVTITLYEYPGDEWLLEATEKVNRTGHRGLTRDEMKGSNGGVDAVRGTSVLRASLAGTEGVSDVVDADRGSAAPTVGVVELEAVEETVESEPEGAWYDVPPEPTGPGRLREGSREQESPELDRPIEDAGGDEGRREGDPSPAAERVVNGVDARWVGPDLSLQAGLPYVVWDDPPLTIPGESDGNSKRDKYVAPASKSTYNGFEPGNTGGISDVTYQLNDQERVIQELSQVNAGLHEKIQGLTDELTVQREKRAWFWQKRGSKGSVALPVLLIPASVAIWGGWVGLGDLAGFGPVNLLPGIGSGWKVDLSITLPISMEAYAAYASRVWLRSKKGTTARRFAIASTLFALCVGMVGQAGYHLLSSLKYDTAPPWVTVLVACVPVAVFGMGMYLTHLERSDDE